ncbi:MAG TPA: sugar ABC transporter permease [Burkholderiaceae bacterium]|nr:sugar ABC transporter permease [Burkholderiaceae bacterium]
MSRPANVSTASSFALLAPAVLMFAAFVIYPLAGNVWVSLHAWDGAGPMTWVGLDNYRELWADPAFAVSVRNNARWLLLYLLAPALGLALAVFLNQSIAGMRLARSLFFMPFVVSQVVVGLVFAWFFHTRFGLFNQILESLGLPPVALLDSEDTAIYTLILAGLWPQVAYCMILYLTGLATVRPELTEAARLDGANGWRLLWHVVLPQLRPVHFIVVMVCVVSALRSFDYVMIMTFGGPHGSTSVLAFYMYEQTFVSSRYGYGAAIATVLLLMMSGIIGVLLWRLLRKERA